MRSVVNLPPPWRVPSFLSPAVTAGDAVYVSGQIGEDPATGEIPPDCSRQTDLAIDWLERILAAAGLTLDDVVKVTVFLRQMTDYQAMNRVYEARFTSPPPARSCVTVADLVAGALVEIEAVAHRPQKDTGGGRRNAQAAELEVRCCRRTGTR
ncbi:MAG: RidA family protein [bacterium]|nr:RidA family protein [bacterium]